MKRRRRPPADPVRVSVTIDFRDGDQNFERRPSLWIEPIGEWGQGMVQLIEIPTENEINDNVIAYWRPKQGLQPGTETFFAYRQFLLESNGRPLTETWLYRWTP